MSLFDRMFAESTATLSQPTRRIERRPLNVALPKKRKSPQTHFDPRHPGVRFVKPMSKPWAAAHNLQKATPGMVGYYWKAAQGDKEAAKWVADHAKDARDAATALLRKHDFPLHEALVRFREMRRSLQEATAPKKADVPRGEHRVVVEAIQALRDSGKQMVTAADIAKLTFGTTDEGALKAVDVLKSLQEVGRVAYNLKTGYTLTGA